MLEQVERWSWKYCSRKSTCLLTALLNMTLDCTPFANSAYPENWALPYEALSMLAKKKNECFQGNCTSLSTLNKKFSSTFSFVPKMNEFLSKNLSHFRHFL